MGHKSKRSNINKRNVALAREKLKEKTLRDGKPLDDTPHDAIGDE